MNVLLPFGAVLLQERRLGARRGTRPWESDNAFSSIMAMCPTP